MVKPGFFSSTVEDADNGAHPAGGGSRSTPAASRERSGRATEKDAYATLLIERSGLAKGLGKRLALIVRL